MTTLTIVAIVSLVLAAIPAGMTLQNLRLFRKPRAAEDRTRPAVSVVIPARNEEKNIVAAVDSVLASSGIDLEVLVVDDQSTDATPTLVGQLAATDPRVRLIQAPTLPSGWCGKQHACQVGADHARHPRLAFLDADVRVLPECLAALSDYLDDNRIQLVSGFPKEVTVSLGEKILIPLIHFILLGFLPFSRMRRNAHPAFAAGCGQLFFADREAYCQSGGHRMIRDSLMDGITLPRSFRRAGFFTDVVDATRLATCRMYDGTVATWKGLSKNAIEGIAHPARILPMTVMLFGGQVLPVGLLVASLGGGPVLGLSAGALALSYAVRGIMRHRFEQSWLGVLLHPLAVLLLLVIQWQSLIGWLWGSQREWRGRKYDPSNEPLVPVELPK